jgi:hypothetical protein
MTNERELLEMALAGYALKRAGIENEIERVRVMLAIANSPIMRMAEKAKREKARKGGRG